MLNQKKQKELEEISKKIRQQSINFHINNPESRIASALSTIEILVTLFFCDFLKFEKKRKMFQNELILSKGHGCFPIYFILKDFNLIKERTKIPIIPEPDKIFIKTINGSLGHGLGVGCGIAIANKIRKLNKLIFVLVGDGELYEGSVWEAIMFAGHHQLKNIVLIIDNNKICMLDYCKNVIDLEPLEKKFESFNWCVKRTDGHNISNLYENINILLTIEDKPKVLIADTIKGMGVKKLMNNPLSHIMSLKKDDIQR